MKISKVFGASKCLKIPTEMTGLLKNGVSPGKSAPTNTPLVPMIATMIGIKAELGSTLTNNLCSH
jgi:hypothetical protein